MFFKVGILKKVKILIKIILEYNKRRVKILKQKKEDYFETLKEIEKITL